MGRKERSSEKDQSQPDYGIGVTLKAVAKRVGLTPGTVSAVLNNSPACRPVPERTKKRIFAAAPEPAYKPNYLPPAPRVKRSFTIGVIASEVGDSYGSLIISGIEQYLHANGFFYWTAVHRSFRVQRQLGHRGDQCVSGCGIESSRKCFGNWFRRYPAGGLFESEADHGSTAATENGRDCGADSPGSNRESKRICRGNRDRARTNRSTVDRS